VEHEPSGRRRHRPFLGVSGLTLFICLFLPFMRVCQHDELALALPPFWAPYFFGALLCVLSAVLSPRATRVVIVLLHCLSYLFITGALVLSALVPPLGPVELVIAVAITIALGNTTRESRIAAATIIIGGLSTIWFAILCTIPDALYGVVVSLVASIGVLGSGVLWRYDIAADKPEEPVPRAVARER